MAPDQGVMGQAAPVNDPFAVTVLAMPPSAVRFGLRYSSRLRTSTWKIGMGSDSSVYIINRPIGGAVKVSLHPRDKERPGHEWRIARAREFSDLEPGSPSRVLDSWDSESMRLRPDSPLKQGFAVVLGRFSLGYHEAPQDAEEAEREERALRAVHWITDLPGVNAAWQVTVFVGDAGARSTAPGTRSMGSTPIGSLTLPNGGQVWVMRHEIPVTDEMRSNIELAVRSALAQLVAEPEDGVHRILLSGREEDGLRWWIETAGTKGAPSGALEIDDGRP